jgi:alpha-galactosidase
LWRTSGDINSDYSSMLSNLNANQAYAAYASPNHWNDADMLEVGNGTVTETEARSHFSLWAIMSSPLLAGNDLRSMSDATREILTNAEVIAVDQDALGLQGVRLRTTGDTQVWAKPLNESGARAVVLFNAGSTTQEISVTWNEIGLRKGDATVRDLWKHADRGSYTDSYTASVAPHDVAALKVMGGEPPIPKGTRYLSSLTWTYAANGLGPVERDQSNGATAANDGQSISLRGTTYAKGLGVAAPSMIMFRLSENCTTFTADVGVDDATKGGGTVVFQVWTDQDPTPLFDSGIVTGTAPAQSVRVDVTGKQRLKLMVRNGGDGSGWDRADWADAKLECAP